MSTTWEGLAVREYGDPEVGTLLARLNPEQITPEPGEEYTPPLPAELIDFDRQLGGLAMNPDDPALPALVARYWRAR